MSRPLFTDLEVEQLRALLELSRELVEMAEFRRAEKASLEATSRLTRGEEQVTRTLVFRTPTQLERQGNNLFGINRSLAVLKTSDGEWKETPFPTDKEIRTAQRSYLGGRLNEITEDEARELLAAGYKPEVRITEGRGTHYEAWQPEEDPTKEEISNAVHQ